jgi:hypothetical protein
MDGQANVLDTTGDAMLHNTLIALHAIAGLGCFAAGVMSLGLRSPESGRFRLYLGCLFALLLFMVAVVAVDWTGLDTTARLVYAGLVALGLYMVWRAVRASTRLSRHGDGWRSRYLDDVGFTLISLFDGFVIVSAIDLHAPGWLVAAIAVGGVVAGVLIMNRVKVRLR